MGGGAYSTTESIRPEEARVDWDETTRAYLKKLREDMPPSIVEWQLDYGGVNDSANKKVSVWSVTVISSVRKQEHFDYFFDQIRHGQERWSHPQVHVGRNVGQLGEVPARG